MASIAPSAVTPSSAAARRRHRRQLRERQKAALLDELHEREDVPRPSLGVQAFQAPKATSALHGLGLGVLAFLAPKATLALHYRGDAALVHGFCVSATSAPEGTNNINGIGPSAMQAPQAPAEPHDAIPRAVFLSLRPPAVPGPRRVRAAPVTTAKEIIEHIMIGCLCEENEAGDLLVEWYGDPTSDDPASTLPRTLHRDARLQLLMASIGVIEGSLAEPSLYHHIPSGIWQGKAVARSSLGGVAARGLAYRRRGEDSFLPSHVQAFFFFASGTFGLYS